MTNYQYKCLPEKSKLPYEKNSNSNRISLFIITQFFTPDFAATGQLIEELARELSNKGVNIEVFTGQPSYTSSNLQASRREQIDLVKVRRTSTTRFWPIRIRGKAINGLVFLFRAFLHIVRHLRGKDVLTVTSAPPFLPILGYLTYLCFKLPYVCIIYDLYPDILVALGVLPKSHPLIQWWYQINYQILRSAKSIVVLSSSMKQKIIEAYPAVKHKITVIHNWSNPEWIVPISKEDNWFAQKYDLVDKFTVLYSGNMGRCHDIETILETIEIMVDKPIQFVFIGSGAKYQPSYEKVKRLGLKNVLFLPYQDKKVLPYSLTACDLSLITMSAGMEGLIAPSKLYPILASGRPLAIICPQNSFLTELVLANNCGKTFENGDSYGLAQFINLLANNPELVKSMGRASRQSLYANFTLEIASQEYLKVMRKAMETSV